MTNNVTALGISKAYFETKIWLRDAIKTEKFFFLFWLAGPFIYLIERSPADAWLSLIALSFLVKCAVRKQWEWTEFTDLPRIYTYASIYRNGRGRNRLSTLGFTPIPYSLTRGCRSTSPRC